MKKVLCPNCWHEDTLRGIRNGYEADHDDATLMRWQRPYGGAKGQQVTSWDTGWWLCGVCGLRLCPRSAAILIDAVLRVSDPDSDSYNKEEKMFEDAIEAANGG